MRISLGKSNTKRVNQLPCRCDLCKKPIGLYKPFYTVMLNGYFLKGKMLRDKILVMCPQCYKAHEAYLQNRKENYIHKNAKAEVEGKT